MDKLMKELYAVARAMRLAQQQFHKKGGQAAKHEAIMREQAMDRFIKTWLEAEPFPQTEEERQAETFFWAVNGCREEQKKYWRVRTQTLLRNAERAERLVDRLLLARSVRTISWTQPIMELA